MTHAAFAALHRPGDPLVLPNVWDFASAAALVGAGFTVLGTTSLGVAAAHGPPDGQGLGRTETLDLARRLQPLPALLTVDIEAGFSDDPAQVAELVVGLVGAGVVGVNLEDGRADGTLSPVDFQVDKIRAIKARVPAVFVNARTDTHWLAGAAAPQLSETVGRLEAYRAAGADAVFVPGLADDDDIRTVIRTVDAPLNVLFIPGWHTVAQLADLGVARISCGSLLFRAAIQAAVDAAKSVLNGQSLPAVPSYADVNALASAGDPAGPLHHLLGG
jgi:2-methylisocitrate lyase-like PEP mutase family enzyme